MMKRLLAACLLFAGALASLSCGTTGGSEARPIEVLYYVSGGPGLDFEFVSEADPACGSPGVGIQSPNSNHQFGDRIFTTPHLFVLENAHQPVRAVIRNLSPTPIQVDMYLGLTQQVGGNAGVINPGECRTIASARQNFTIDQIGPEIRTEVCSAADGLDVSCLSQPPAQDRFVAFFGSTGDLVATNITNCILTPFLDACRTPATFFWQNPQDQFAAVMSVNPGQDPEGQPKSKLRTELYVDGNLHETARGTEPIVQYDL